MNLPGSRLHPLKGDLKGFWSVAVRANWRIIFRFQDGHVWDVDLTSIMRYFTENRILFLESFH